MPWSFAIRETMSTAYSFPNPPKSSAMPFSGRNTLPGSRRTLDQPTSFSAADRLGRRDRRGIGLPVPDPDERERRRVEYPARHEVERVAHREQALRLRVHLDPLLARGVVDPADEAPGLEAGVLGLEGVDPACGGRLELRRLGVPARRGILHLALGRHRPERELPQGRAVPAPRGRRFRGAVLSRDDGHGDSGARPTRRSELPRCRCWRPDRRSPESPRRARSSRTGRRPRPAGCGR
jgi:hypothetical protein